MQSTRRTTIAAAVILPLGFATDATRVQANATTGYGTGAYGTSAYGGTLTETANELPGPGILTTLGVVLFVVFVGLIRQLSRTAETSSNE